MASPREESFYEIIGVPSNATAAEIKKAYRKKSLEWHPDKAQERGVPASELQQYTEKFQKLTYAYEVLSDPVKKAEYDFQLNAVQYAQRPPPPQTPPQQPRAQQPPPPQTPPQQPRAQQTPPPQTPPQQPRAQQTPPPQAQEKPRSQSQSDIPRQPPPQGTFRPASAPPKAAGINNLDSNMMELFNTERTFTNGLGRLGEAVAYMKNINPKLKTASPATYDLLGKMANVADELKAKYPNGIQSTITKQGDSYQFDHQKLQDYIKMVGKAFDLSAKFNNPANAAEGAKVLADAKDNNIPDNHKEAFNKFPITPVQRLPRYVLLFKEAVKNAGEDKADDFQKALDFSQKLTEFKNGGLNPDSYKEAMKEIVSLVNKLSDSSATKVNYVKQLREIKNDFANQQYPDSMKRVEAMATIAATNISKNQDRKLYSQETRDLHQQIANKCAKLVEAYQNPFVREALQAPVKKTGNTTANMYQSLKANYANAERWRTSTSGKQRSDREIVLKRSNPAVAELRQAHTQLNNAIREGKKAVVDQKKMQGYLDKAQKHLQNAQGINDKRNRDGKTKQRERTQAVVNKLTDIMNRTSEGLKLLNSSQAPTPPPTGRRMGR